MLRVPLGKLESGPMQKSLPGFDLPSNQIGAQGLGEKAQHCVASYLFENSMCVWLLKSVCACMGWGPRVQHGAHCVADLWFLDDELEALQPHKHTRFYIFQKQLGFAVSPLQVSVPIIPSGEASWWFQIGSDYQWVFGVSKYGVR